MKQTTDNHTSHAIVDARDWQNQFDLRTGGKSDENGLLIEMMKEVLHQHPYPGDLDPGSNQWVTDTALDLSARYHPQFTFLTYAHQYFAGRVGTLTAPDRHKLMADLFQEVERFCAESGCTPVIVGRGDVTPLRGVIDLSGLSGIGISTHWSARYAGLHEPSTADMKLMEADPNIEKIVTRKAFLELFEGTPQDSRLLPDYLLVARPGFSFRALGCTMRKPLMIPNALPSIPFFSPLGDAAELTSIREMIDNGLNQGRKIALIILEGVGNDDFPWPSTPCANNKEWFCYEPGDAQYLAITTGQHRILEHPPGYLFYEDVDKEQNYPLSGYYTKIPSGTIGADFSGRSIAVGNKSMAMHMVAGADLCVECFSRNHYNQGTLGVVHRQNKL